MFAVRNHLTPIRSREGQFKFKSPPDSLRKLFDFHSSLVFLEYDSRRRRAAKVRVGRDGVLAGLFAPERNKENKLNWGNLSFDRSAVCDFGRTDLN
jgi:hypothetical protein